MTATPPRGYEDDAYTAKRVVDAFRRLLTRKSTTDTKRANPQVAEGQEVTRLHALSD